jgi:molybdopterin-containing oxidoreductase family iron-sulfur binding subunit
MENEKKTEGEQKQEIAQDNEKGRRNFLRMGLMTGGTIALGSFGAQKIFSKSTSAAPVAGSGVKKYLLCASDGKVYEADVAHLNEYHGGAVNNQEARKGIPGRKFIMVIDLAKCDGCGKCTEACQAMHFIPPDREWIKVYKMKDSAATQPYWFPKPCYHCDNPPCTKVCPVNATFKREDGIVLIDNERCIGCRMCMAACPYSSRFFNWSMPEPIPGMDASSYSPEKGYPRRIGTVEKCDFCPDMARQGKLPACVSGCPMDALYFGDQNEDAVTNSSGVTVRLSQLLEDNAGYRHLEDLGTEPRVYYLPPKNRKYPLPQLNKNEEKKNKSRNKEEMKM